MRNFLIYIILIHTTVFASEGFIYSEWQTVCDNTNTCRLVGYTEALRSSKSQFPISIMLERKAGANSKIDGYVNIDNYNYENNFELKNQTLKMIIAKKTYLINKSWKLSPAQTNILVDALVTEKQIFFTYGDIQKWEFSQKGSFAAMLKMDDLQKRIGTIGAIYKKGKKDESGVLQQEPVPVLNVPALYNNLKNNNIPKITLTSRDKTLLQDLLSTDYNNNICWSDYEEAKKTLSIYRLTDKLALASQLCWMGAYNAASAFWLINIKPPFKPKYMASGNAFYINNDGSAHISNSHKSRGIGDCWSFNELTWNGERFIENSRSTTGLCRGFAGGAWDLPEIIMKVKTPNSLDIITEKTYLYSQAGEKRTRAYLIKDDRVKILKTEGEWIYILYKGKKDIKAWIPKKSVIN